MQSNKCEKTGAASACSTFKEPTEIREGQLTMERETSSCSSRGKKEELHNACNDDGSDEEQLCPLFMEGLPKDFADNPRLAAIASLLEEDNKEEGARSKTDLSSLGTSPAPRAGGGKLSGTSWHCQSRMEHGHRPYQKRKPDRQKATLGEAQLFFNMWKI